jgi:hypothetical protein
MNSFESSLFLVPIGFGSSVILYLSAHTDNNFSLFTDNNTYNYQIAELLLISFFYFVIDFFLMIKRYRPQNRIYFVHHILGTISILVVYFQHYHLVKYLLAYLTFELSTPFLNIAIVNDRSHISNYFTMTIDVIFFLLFTTVRILFGTYLLYAVVPLMYSLEYPIYYLTLIPIILQNMNYWWYRKLIKKFVHKLKIVK